MLVAFQGEPGAFSEEAAAALLGDVPVRGFRTFADAIDALKTGVATHALLPFENSTCGEIVEVHELLDQNPGLRVIDEISHAVQQCLIVLPGTQLAQITSVASHPVALAQCRLFLEQHPEWSAVQADDTAGSVREMVARGEAGAAAIGPASAAKRYGASVLIAGIQDDPQNFTRFLLLRAA